jgi:hypothetical protein
MSETVTVPQSPNETKCSTVRRFFSNVYLRPWLVIILGIVVLWIFRTHLKELGSLLWPIVVAGAIYGFRTELSTLLTRVRRVSKEGAEFGEARIAAQIMAQPVDVALKDVAPDEAHPPYIMQRVDELRVELNARVPEDEQRREYLLMLRLAQAQQLTYFHLTWLNIFSSQLEALTKMAAEEGPIELTPYHELHTSRTTAAATAENPANSLSFGVWANFFVQRQLATISERQATITQQGRDLLELSTRANFPRFQIF